MKVIPRHIDTTAIIRESKSAIPPYIRVIHPDGVDIFEYETLLNRESMLKEACQLCNFLLEKGVISCVRDEVNTPGIHYLVDTDSTIKERAK